MARIYTAQETFQQPGLPPVTKTLLVLNVLIFVAFNLLGFAGGQKGDLYNWLSLQPGDFFRPWQLLTHAFLHGGFGHILFNMFALWMFGAAVEQVFGWLKFLLFYLLCALGGGLAYWLLWPVAPAVGASGALYGVLTAFGLLFPDALVFLYFVPIKGKYLVIVFFAMELLLGVTGTQSGVAHFAHLGGLVTAYLFMAITTRSIPGLSAFRRDRIMPTEPTLVVPPTRSVPTADELPRREPEPVVEEARIVRETPRAEIDRILAKIASDGMTALTSTERELLLSATKR